MPVAGSVHMPSKRVPVEQLPEVARKVRIDVLEMTYRAGSGHPGGSFSATEALVALYFGGVLRHDPQRPQWEDRDRFVLSKGHCSPAMYAVLAEAGYFPREELRGFRRMGAMLQGHVDIKVPGVEFSAGSLGQGLSFANGAALGLRLDGKPSRVYVMMGDGEVQEGQVWEAAMTAAHYKLDSLCAILDWNKVSQTGFVDANKRIEPLVDKFRAFGWHAEKVDGHSFPALLAAFDRAARVKGQPSMIVADTQKGHGVSFMELRSEFHGRALTDEEMQRAMKELGAPWSPPAKGGA